MAIPDMVFATFSGPCCNDNFVPKAKVYCGFPKTEGPFDGLNYYLQLCFIGYFGSP